MSGTRSEYNLVGNRRHTRPGYGNHRISQVQVHGYAQFVAVKVNVPANTTRSDGCTQGVPTKSCPRKTIMYNYTVTMPGRIITTFSCCFFLLQLEPRPGSGPPLREQCHVRPVLPGIVGLTGARRLRQRRWPRFLFYDGVRQRPGRAVPQRRQLAVPKRHDRARAAKFSTPSPSSSLGVTAVTSARHQSPAFHLGCLPVYLQDRGRISEFQLDTGLSAI